MVQKYLSEFYSVKVMRPGSRREVADPSSPLELQIRSHVLAGDEAFLQAKFSVALQHYLAAWGLFPRIVYPDFPTIVSMIDDMKLASINLEEPLIVTSALLLRYRDAIGQHGPIVAPGDPPDVLIEIATAFGKPYAQGTYLYQVGKTYAQLGDSRTAGAIMEQVEGLAGNDVELLADVQGSLGALAVQHGNLDRAQSHYAKATEIYQQTTRQDGVAAMQHNLGVVSTLGGNFDVAGRHFSEAANTAPVSLGWQVTQTFNPGIASITRPTGTAGLSLLVKDTAGQWETVPSGWQARAKDAVNVIAGSGAVELDLLTGAASIEATLFQPRINATTLAALEMYLWDVTQFVSYLTHVQGFVLPLDLGDTYAALGDYNRAATYYLKARDYPYLNRAIEAPMVWRKLAQTHVRLGNRLYRDRDIAGARAQYERIVQVTPGGFVLAGPLYEGGFAALQAETLAFLNAPDRLAFANIEYARRIIILEALANLNQIVNGINYLGFPEEIVPIHHWRYLQNAARYFANQAIQSERAYISFRESAERDEFTRLSLHQAVDAQSAALDVEDRRIQAAVEQRRAASVASDLARVRLNNAINQRNDYAATSQQLAVLDEINAWATGPMDRAEINASWSNVLGIQPGEYDTYQITRLAARQRSQISRGYEVRNMDRSIAEMQAGLVAANAQVSVADRMIDVAVAQRDLAALRLDQAQAQLAFFDAQEFTPELWDNLAQAQREISRRYLDWAIGAAFLMERAFEFEYDAEVNRIRFDYERSELNGLLAADFLLADIDSFSYDRLLETEKAVPAKITISLADRYPFPFYQQFQRTGRLDFELLLEDLDLLHPGAYLRKLRRVEVVIEGLVGPQGLHGTLTNSGVSRDRGRDGRPRLRVQKPETMLLSRYDLRRDGFVFTHDEDVLAVFENTGIAGGWALVFPPDANDIDYRNITNIHLVFYFDAYHSQRVANAVRAELAASALYESTLGLALRFQFPDEFFAFQDTGAVTFTVDTAYLPFNHAAPRIRDLYVKLETAGGVSPSGVTVSIGAAGSGTSVDQATDANGLISTDLANVPLNQLRTGAVADTWTIRIDQAANAAAFAAGFSWEVVSNIYLVFEYAYTPRGRPIAGDDFSADSLASFDVIDDPQAAVGGPSQWAHNAAQPAVEQLSAIHAPAGAANQNTSPDKPGTYLVRQVAAGWPALGDVVLSCRIQSTADDGIGVVLRYQDQDNFLFFLMDAERQYRRLGKKVGGVFGELATPALDTTQGYTPGQTYELTVAAVDDVLTVYLDGAEILSGRDQSLTAPGRVGFYAWNNPGARFMDLRVQPT